LKVYLSHGAQCRGFDAIIPGELVGSLSAHVQRLDDDDDDDHDDDSCNLS
jgi:hypothetical protein